MGWLSKIFGGATAQPIEAVFKGLAELTTSDEERAQLDILKIKALQEPDKLQVELNKIEAQHRSIFVAGWRPFIGWICGIGLSFPFIINPVLQWLTSKPGPILPIENLMELVLAMLGLGALRTVEKMNGKAK
jgi:hypothetical protein